jgi:hypothetical protein
MPSCINLHELCGDRFRIEYDPAYEADLGRGVRRHDPWLMLLPCRGGRGEIGPWSDTELAAYLNKPKLVHTLVKLGGRLFNRGDADATVVFPVELFDAVAQIMRPRVKRYLSPERGRRTSSGCSSLAPGGPNGRQPKEAKRQPPRLRPQKHCPLAVPKPFETSVRLGSGQATSGPARDSPRRTQAARRPPRVAASLRAQSHTSDQGKLPSGALPRLGTASKTLDRLSPPL